MATKSELFKLPLESWIALQLKLLEDERGEEVAQAAEAFASGDISGLEAKGLTLPRLTVLDVSTGLFGRRLVVCGDHLHRLLPSHRFTPGDIVGVRLSGGGRVGGGGSSALQAGGSVRASYDASGVVTAADDKSVTLALDDSADAGAGEERAELDQGDRCRLDRLADDVTFKRLKDALTTLKSARNGPADRLFSILFQGGEHSAAKGGKPPPTTSAGGWCTPHFLPAVPPVLAKGKGAPPASSSSSSSDDSGSSSSSSSAAPEWQPIHANLNAGQRAAITSALRATDLCMIHGPPGTGKTTTVVEYIRQEVARGRRVLACAPSNVAVDNLLERLAAGVPGGSSGSSSGLRLVRLGHPARVSPLLQQHTLEAALQAAEGSAMVREAKRELGRLAGDIARCRHKGTRRELRAEEREVKREVREREERVLGEVLRGAQVVLCTVTGAATRMLARGLSSGAGGAAQGIVQGTGASAEGGSGGPLSSHFHVTVIDEVAQALEAACLIPMLLSPRLVVAGDHCQLAPTITSQAAAAGGLQHTLADRIVALFGSGGGSSSSSSSSSSAAPPLCPFATALPVVHMLTEQYRMHQVISDWSSEAMYGGRLRAHPSVQHHRLSQLPGTTFPGGLEAEEAGLAGGAGSSSASSSSSSAAPLASFTVSAADLADLRLAALESAKESLAEEEEDRRQSSSSSSSSSGSGEVKKQGSKGKGGGAGGGARHRMDGATAAAIISHTSAAFQGAQGGDIELDAVALNAPMLFVDTAGCGLGEVDEAHAVPDEGSSSSSSKRGSSAAKAAGAATSSTPPSASTGSKANLGEADIVVKHVLALVQGCGLRPRDIGVITPYSAQTSLLRVLLCHRFPGITVSTVDGFQGMEQEAIILSCVRSNGARAVGFLKDARRMNVAVTRARRHVCIVGDSETLGSNPFLAALVAYAGEKGQVRTAMEYQEMYGLSAEGGGEEGGGGGAAAGYALGDFAAAASGGRFVVPAAAGPAHSASSASSAAPALKKKVDSAVLIKALRRQFFSFLTGVDGVVQSAEGGGEAAPAAAAAAAAASAAATTVPGLQLEGVSSALPRDTKPFGTVAVGMGSGSCSGSGIGSSAVPSLTYPPTLSSYHRALVHEVAEALGLPHASAGEGAARCVSVQWVPWAARKARKELLSGGGGVKGGGGEEQEQEEVLAVSSILDRLALLGEEEELEEEQQQQEQVVAGGEVKPAGGEGKSAAGGAPESAPAPTAPALLQTAPQPLPSAPTQASSSPSSSSSSSSAAAAPAAAAVAAPPPKPLTLAAQLNAERQARLQAAAAAQAAAALAASLAEFGDVRGKPGKGPSAAAPAAASKGRVVGGGGGMPVARLQPLQAELSKGGKKAPKAAAAAAAAAGQDEEDEMALLDAVCASMNSCPVLKCKSPTHATGTTCPFCHLRFCLAHGQAEVHGCGEAVRAAARGEWLGGGGSRQLGVGQPVLTAAKRELLARQLHKKIEAGEKERARKGGGGKE